MVNLDHNRISTIAISLAGAILAAIIADPSLLQALMGSYYVQYGAVALVVMGIVYNIMFPGNKAPEPVEPASVDEIA